MLIQDFKLSINKMIETLVNKLYLRSILYLLNFYTLTIIKC